MKHTERQRARLGELGLRIKFEWPDRYSVDEAKVWVFGNTFPVKDIMSKHGFKFGSGRDGRGWWMPTVEFMVVGDKWGNDILRGMPKKVDPGGDAVFSAMSRSNLLQFVKKVVERDMEFNEWYDGEVSDREVTMRYMKRLPNLKPHEQEAAMKRWQAGDLP